MPRHLPLAAALFALAVGLTLAVGAGRAEDTPKRPGLEAAFKKFDANGDGKLSHEEFNQFVQSAPRIKAQPKAKDFLFKRLDADGDGFLTLDEFKKLADLGPKKDNDTPNKGGSLKGKTEPAPTPKNNAEATKEPTAEQVAFFEKKIRPVLVGKCYSCHSESAEKIKGGLTLDTRAGLRKGGESGPALVPGAPKKSLLIHALRGTDNSAQMPPKEKLTEDTIADFEKWIAMGAPDPRGKAGAKNANAAIDIEQGRTHWAFQPPKAAAVPAVKNVAWPKTDADRFLLAKLEEKGLTPASDADKRAILRRVTFDLTGLPPTPEELDEFLNDNSPNAFAKVVDRLLASPAFGETWGRHWLDVARYAESSGKEQNIVYPHAWRYRDYVIQAFNKDKPYARFLREQLAGDLIPAKDDAEKAEQLIATGYLAVGPKSHNEPNPLHFRLDVADEQIDAFSQGMLGMTVACARCHDHKFDPIPTHDYYALAGIFTSTETKFGIPQGGVFRQNASLIDLPTGADVPAGLVLSKTEQGFLKKRVDDLKKERDEAREQARKDKQPPIRLVGINNQIAILEKQLSHFEADGSPKKQAMGVGDKMAPRDSPVYTRGEPEKPGEIVSRGFLQVVNTVHTPPVKNGSGRRELAQWVASKDNPLTARVWANRVWLHLFGRGIVSSPDNFGTTGQPPSHPELLDYLALSLMEHGWSTKKLIRGIVLSHAYQMSSTYDAKNAATDPDNVYVWRMSKRRLGAESVRDAMLAVAGQLDITPANGSPVGRFEGPVQVLNRGGGMAVMAETNHRSVYLPIVRGQVPEVLELFDFAEPSLVTGARDDTSVPSQGLFLMNNPSVMKLAEKTATRLLGRYQSPTERVDAAFRLTFGRSPTPTEATAATTFIDSFARDSGKGRKSATEAEKAAWAAFSQALFATAEFRYVD
ncbi:DUF1549 domain-containing protein [Fimbriiglobus ruber]|uniref:EF-hand domain-containing protein n=1 Tax=Fimbriiglobus ruber TaxID=1908690 RepID=A0A225DQW9_9BACT|nr:DUF1549 domain-containing protein [Fimbriiglobus ruber]OWK43493.1 hypothetical protein FRUB_03092 [Fimbriiglobus ruber]